MDSLLQAEIARDQSSRQTDYDKKQRLQYEPSQPTAAQIHGPLKPNIFAAPRSDESNFVEEWSSHSHGAALTGQRSLDAQYKVREQHSSPSLTLERSGTARDNSTPVIDTLTKQKQRQIYSIISGIQGGIEHLKRQLDSLKVTLGIEDDDPTGLQRGQI